MEEAHEILLNSLEGSGISLPTGVSSIQDLTPGALVSICAQSLRLIDGSSSFPTSLPISMAERFKICTDIASAVKGLGYRGDLSFHQFLYPSDDDSYKLVRFLVERLSQTSEGRKVAGKNEINARFRGNKVLFDKVGGALKDWIEGGDPPSADQSNHTVPSRTRSLRIGNQETQSGKKDAPVITCQGKPEASNAVAEDVFKHGLLEAHIMPGQMDESAIAEKDGQRAEVDVREPFREPGTLTSDASVDGESMEQRNDRSVRELEQKVASLRDQSSKMRLEAEDLQRQEKMLMEEVSARTLEVQHLEDDHMLLKGAVEMAFDDQHPDGFYVEELNKRVNTRRDNLMELELQWDAFKRPLEEKKMSLEQSLHERKIKSGEKEKLLRLEKVELELKATTSEILKREEENSKLSVELETQPKIASRKSYIQRITEITKNSRKQDADIDRILQETRQVQIESNSIQDRLHRTYMVVDETVFRDAKNDPVRRQAYRLLTTIHDSFEQMSNKILATDRARREAAEQEAKLSAMASRSFDTDKLQVDLDAIRKENDLLEQRLRRN
ncbi:uncharacterized protein LOC131257925 [Magnolia sinica]|uniref:uncharacterized protein LOC131257925 n=1 Tax=Magnolia sinica TaxID=86752 RepID=UPI0026588572|nr:uncharacterized protein LOC131257925 [Magnolia sinica]